MTTFKKHMGILLMLCLFIVLFTAFSINIFAADEITVNIVSFTRGEQADLRSSELLEARVEGYDGNVRELTYKWTNGLGTYLYVYNSHNMYGINNTDGEIEIYNSNVSSSANMSGRSYKNSYEGTGFAWAAVYGADLSASDLVGTVTVEVYDADGKLLATDSHEGYRVKTGGFWWWETYEYYGFVDSNLDDDISHVYFGLFEGDTKNVKILLGESSIVHITCVECTISEPVVTEGKDIIKLEVDTETNEWHIKSISGTSSGEAKVQITLEKGNCKFHKDYTATRTIEVYVYKKPTTTSTSTVIMLDNLDDRCTYYIGGAKGERRTVDGEEYVVFEGLTPNTEYQVEVVGQENENTDPVYAYVYETTKPAHTGTIEVILNGTYDASTGEAIGERVDIATVMPEVETIYLRYEDSEIYFPLEQTDTGVYTSVLSDGNYTLYYSESGSDEKIRLDEQILTISGASRTRELFFNSVTYDANGGEAEIPTEYYLVNSKVMVSDIVPAKEGYLFSHWLCQSGHEHKAGDVLSEAIGEEYSLVAQYVEANDVYVDIVINHLASDGLSVNNEEYMHNIVFTVDQRFGGEGDYTELVSHSVTWDGSSYYFEDDFTAMHSANTTTYIGKSPILMNVAKDAEYTFTSNKSGYDLVSVTRETDANGDYRITATLVFDPNNFDFTYTVELDEESMKVADNLKPVAVNAKVIGWGDTPYDDTDADTWVTISQHYNTYERIVLDENGKGIDTYPVWTVASDTNEPYYYRIEIVSYETADGTVIPAINESGKHIIYHTELNRYSAEVFVEGGAAPSGSTLNGAYYDSEKGTQVGTVNAVVTIEVFDVTFDPNGGTLNGTEENTVLKYQIGIPTLADYTPERAGGYVFDGWYIADGNGNMTGEAAVSDTIIFKDTTLIAKWKEPLTVKGNIAVAGTYENDDGDIINIYEHDRITSAVVLLQRIDANGYAETVNTMVVPLTYAGGYGIGTYEFTEIADNNHEYRIKTVAANYHTHYHNETSSANVNEYDKYAEETEAEMYLAEFAGDTEAVVNLYLHFVPESFKLLYEIDTTSIGEGFRPSLAEVLVLCDTGEHIDPQHWDVISQMVDGNDFAGNISEITDGKGSGSEQVWKIKADGATPYHYSIRIDSLTFDGVEFEDAQNLPYAIYYNGSARYSDVNDAPTQILTATIVPRMYTITYDLGDLPEDVAVSGMDEYISMEQTLVDDYYWSYGKAISAKPTADGYIFLGWYDANGDKVTAIAAESANNVTLYAKWTVSVEFEMLFDAGYYSEARDLAEKEGIISLNARISNFDAVKDNIDSFGIYIYDTTGASVNITAVSIDTAQLEESGGEYHVTISSIAAETFSEKILAAPYVVIEDEIIIGDTMTGSVAQINKWLGEKGK